LTRRLVTVALATTFAAACSAGASAGRDARASDYVYVDPRSDVCDGLDAGEAASPPYDLIQRIFIENCVACHSPGADLDLSAGASWGHLVDQPAPAAEACGQTLVVPGAPDASYLYQKLSSDQPCAGYRMPRSDFGSVPLPDCVIALVRSWIAAGALPPASDAATQ
jgi:hypothetical protein